MRMDGTPLVSTTTSVIAFGAAGALSRYTLRTTETRWQIAAFAAAAVSTEIIRLATDTRPSWLRGGASALAAAIILTLVKFDVEPAARRHDTAIVKREVRKVARNLK